MSLTLTAMSLRRPSLDRASAKLSTLGAALVACVLLICLAPLMLIAALAILIETGWPIFFVQARLGQHGKLFRMYKYRKFHIRQDTHGLALTLRNDARMTHVGRLIERTKIDELPQLWNIVKGDMAFVGPRPETPNFVDCFGNSGQELLRHRPGIFGPSQTMFRNESAWYRPGCDPEIFYRQVLFPMKLRMDLAYYSHRSWIADLNWVLRGVAAVVGGSLSRGADNVAIEEIERGGRRYAEGYHSSVSGSGATKKATAMQGADK